MADGTTSPQTETGSQTSTESEVTTTTTGVCEVGMLGCPCTGGGACDPGLECNAQKRCEDNPGINTETMSTDPSMPGTSTSTGETTDEPSTGTTGPVGRECTPAGDGLESAECVALDPNRPFCDGDTCKPCGDVIADACFDATNGERPVCHSSGRCVQCDAFDALGSFQCEAAKPHCNLDNNTCEGCFEHSECPESACDIAKRKCLPKNQVLYIRQAAPCSAVPGQGGNMDEPFCDFATALTTAKDTGIGDWTFHLLGNLDNTSPGAVTVAPGGPPVTYAFVHAPGGLGEAHTQFKDEGPLIVVGSDVTLYIKGFGIIVDSGFLDSSRGIDCQEGASVWLDDSRVSGARGANIRGTGCKIRLRRSVVGPGKTEGIDMNGGSLFAVNSFISKNGYLAKNGGGGLRMRGGATADINFTTIADNQGEPGFGLGDSIQCDDEMVSIKIRNSIVAHYPDSGNLSVVCPQDKITADGSVIDTVLPGNNAKLAAENILEALDEGGKVSGVYRLSTDREDAAAVMTHFVGAAQWQPGDPHFDFDLDPRDTVDVMNGVVGADVFP